MELKKYKLGDCLTMIENGAVIKQKKNAGGIPITRIETLSNDRFNRDRLGYADIFDESSYSHFILDDMDLIMSHINSRTFLGRTVIYRKHGDEKIIHGMNVLRLKTDIKVLNPLYAYYYFKTNGFRTAIDHIRKDAINQSSLATSDIKNLEILIPSIEEQSVIVSILDNLDRKIALNRSINQNLEALAKQLYDYWFVQFDFPNEEEKPYKSSGGAMVYSDTLRRNIPSNWEVKELGKTCEILLGGTPDTGNELFWGGPYSWLNSGEVAEFPILKSEKTITEEGLNSSATAYAPKGSVTLSITRHLRPSILAIDACINQSVVAIKETEHLRKEYLYPLINREIPRYMTLRTGAQQPHINKETVESTWIIIPPTGILDKYYLTVSPIYHSIIENAIEIENLIKQRDELLPLLMNGQVSLNSDLLHG